MCTCIYVGHQRWLVAGRVKAAGPRCAEAMWTRHVRAAGPAEQGEGFWSWGEGRAPVWGSGPGAPFCFPSLVVAGRGWRKAGEPSCSFPGWVRAGVVCGWPGGPCAQSGEGEKGNHGEVLCRYMEQVVLAVWSVWREGQNTANKVLIATFSWWNRCFRLVLAACSKRWCPVVLLFLVLEQSCCYSWKKWSNP